MSVFWNLDLIWYFTTYDWLLDDWYGPWGKHLSPFSRSHVSRSLILILLPLNTHWLCWVNQNVLVLGNGPEQPHEAPPMKCLRHRRLLFPHPLLLSPSTQFWDTSQVQLQPMVGNIISCHRKWYCSWRKSPNITTSFKEPEHWKKILSSSHECGTVSRLASSRSTSGELLNRVG